MGADGVRLHTLYRHCALFASSLRPIGGAHGTRQACHYVRECLSPQKAEARMISASEPITCAERCSRRYHKTGNAVAWLCPSASGVTTFADNRQTTVGQHSIVAKRYTNDESGITSSQTFFFRQSVPWHRARIGDRMREVFCSQDTGGLGWLPVAELSEDTGALGKRKERQTVTESHALTAPITGGRQVYSEEVVYERIMRQSA